MTTKRTRRPNLPEDFRRDAVALVTEQGYSQAEAARSLGIGANLIGRWKRQLEDEASGKGLSKDEREELKQLRREVRELKMEKDILEKASAYFAKQMK
ncbi:MAG: transposase [Gammaproteobacteria bacterium]